MFYVYIIRSIKKKIAYVGFTHISVHDRLIEHNQKKSRWTNMYVPWELIYYESYFCEKDARYREKFLKSGFGNKLVTLIKNNY